MVKKTAEYLLVFRWICCLCHTNQKKGSAVVIFSLYFLFHSEQKVQPLDKLITEDTVPPLCLPATAQVVRLVPDSTVPENDDQIRKEDEDPRQFRAQSPLGYLEVTDVARR